MSDDGVLDQSDIERLLGGGGNAGNTGNTGNAGNTGNDGTPSGSGSQNTSGAASGDGTISQSELDALFGSGTKPAASNSSPSPPDSTISQSDLDALLGGANNSSASSTPTPSKASASGPLEQSDLDALFNNTAGSSSDSVPTAGPIDQAALDVLFGSNTSSKASAVQSEPTFVPSTPYDPTQPSIPVSKSAYGGSASGLGSGIGNNNGNDNLGENNSGGSFASTMSDIGDEEDGLPNGDLNYLLERAEKSIQSIASERLIPNEVIEFQFPEFGGTVPSAEQATLDQISEVELNVKIELGRTDMYLEDVLKLRKGSVVPLDKTAGDPVDIYVNGRLLARGEVLVMNENFCVRVAELLAGAIPME
ncbi:MAG: flagellar motor switch protein FliN [Planctomycetaceae bacterium]|jgi:flagellar motor switch protein FliN/FliY|nr:flagellar motor switch protein FliN [Planctomycetaceae bacterium]